MTQNYLKSDSFNVDGLDEAIELCYEKGWTDGLPVVPPTESSVLRFIEASGRKPDQELGGYAPRKLTATVEKVAINSVMAGCLPEYFPTVLAIIEAMLDESKGQLVDVSTGGVASGFIVNGPIRNELRMNCKGNVLGPGNRANSTIGRAVRLAMMNVLGSVPGAGNVNEVGRDILDRSTIGQPGKYTCYHIPENEEAFPSLNPLHVELGFQKEQNVVTVFPVSGHIQVSVHPEDSSERIVGTIAHYMAHSGRMSQNLPGLANANIGSWVVIISPEKAEFFVKDGWSKADIRQALFELTSRSVSWLKKNGWLATNFIGERGEAIEAGDDDKYVSITTKPEDIFPVIAGGPAGGWIHFLMPYLGGARSKVIT